MNHLKPKSALEVAQLIEIASPWGMDRYREECQQAIRLCEHAATLVRDNLILRWTNAVPTIAGFYWRMEGEWAPSVHEVDVTRGGIWSYRDTYGDLNEIRPSPDVKWCGPLALPEEPT